MKNYWRWKKRRTGDEAFWSINNGGISCKGAIDASLYICGNDTGTDAISCGAGLGKRRINRIFNLWTKTLNLPSPSTGRNHKLQCTAIHTHEKKKTPFSKTPANLKDDENIILTGPELARLARIMSSERRAVTARGWSPGPKSQCE